MAHFKVDTDKVITSSQEIISMSMKLENMKEDISGIRLSNFFDPVTAWRVNQSIKRLINNVSSEVLSMKTMGDALDSIAKEYIKTEGKISGQGEIGAGLKEAVERAIAPSDRGTDKRNWWQKLWDRITHRQPNTYDTTTAEQEKAADDAMRRKLKNVLSDEKYSPENWDRASVEERKQILQDYMNEVIKIYGLSDVSSKIVWKDCTYTDNSVTWGYYSHGNHRVTLNEKALTDSKGGWDSYELLGTVAHELRHAYQHEAVDNPTKFKVSQETLDSWKHNIKNYISSDEDFKGYYNQTIEVDARSFEVDRG